MLNRKLKLDTTVIFKYKDTWVKGNIEGITTKEWSEQDRTYGYWCKAKSVEYEISFHDPYSVTSSYYTSRITLSRDQLYTEKEWMSMVKTNLDNAINLMNKTTTIQTVEEAK